MLNPSTGYVSQCGQAVTPEQAIRMALWPQGFLAACRNATQTKPLCPWGCSIVRAIRLLLAAVLVVAWGPLAAKAAVVSSQSGNVLISTGDGFVPLAGPVELQAGGQVMVQPGGLATITYAGNCTVRVGSGVWLVQPAPPCKEAAVIDFTTRMNQQTPPPNQQQDFDPAAIAIILGGGVAVATCVFWWCRDHNRPASP